MRPVVLSAEALDGILDSLRRDGDYMRRRAERQAEARQGWVEGLSFKPASIQQADRPPLTFGQRVKESVDKACAESPGHIRPYAQRHWVSKPLCGQSEACLSGTPERRSEQNSIDLKNRRARTIRGAE